MAPWPKRWGSRATISWRVRPEAEGMAMLEALSSGYGLHVFSHHGPPLSPIAELARDDVDGDTVAVLRGEILFAGAEEVLTRLAPFVGDRGRLVLDFTNVTRVGDGARKVFLALQRSATVGADPRSNIAIRDPHGVLGDD